jgi:putative transposase
MRKTRFTDELIVAILREADRETIAVVAKRHGVLEQTVYTWRKRFATFQADDVRRLKQLEAGNARCSNQHSLADHKRFSKRFGCSAFHAAQAG